MAPRPPIQARTRRGTSPPKRRFRMTARRQASRGRREGSRRTYMRWRVLAVVVQGKRHLGRQR
jgi:hypothetical protein